MYELAEIAADAALALDNCRLARPCQTADIRSLLEKLYPLVHISMSTDPTLIRIAYRAYGRWSGEGLRTVPELQQKARIINDRLASVASHPTTAKPEEVATLRDFCTELSQQALVHA